MKIRHEGNGTNDFLRDLQINKIEDCGAEDFKASLKFYLDSSKVDYI